MRFRRDAPLALGTVAVVVVVAITVVSSWLFGGMTSAVERQQLDLLRRVVEFNLAGANSRALARAELVASMPEVREALAARDRDRLRRITADLWTNQHDRHAVDQAQFHVPPAESFLRLHAPEQFGDDLTSFRPLVVEVNRDHQPRAAYGIARGGPAIFAVVPVLAPDGGPTGSFEFGVAFGPLLSGLQTAYDLDLAVFVQEKPLREIATQLGPETFKDDNLVGEYVKLESTNWDLVRQLVGSRELTAASGAYVREADGVPYGVVLVPLANASGVQSGVVLVAQDFSSTRAATGRARVWQGLLGLVGIVVLVGAAIVVIRGFLLQPLEVVTRGFAALADGTPEPLPDEVRRASEEIAALAAQHDRLRERSGGGGST